MKKISGFLFVVIVCVFFSAVKILKADSPKITLLEDVSFRAESGEVKQGIRFVAKLDESVKEFSHGFYLAYGKTTISKLDAEIKKANPTLNGKKIFDVAVYGLDDDNCFSIVITGIPEYGYLDKISVIAYYNDGAKNYYVEAPITESMGEVALRFNEKGITDAAIINIIDGLNISSIKDFLKSSGEEMFLCGVVSHMGAYSSYSFFDNSGSISLYIPYYSKNEVNFIVGDKLFINAKKTVEQGLIQAELVTSLNDLIILSSNNATGLKTNLTNQDLITEKLLQYQANLLKIDNLFVKSIATFKMGTLDIIHFKLINSLGQEITLRWDERVEFANSETIKNLAVGDNLNLDGVSLSWLNEPLLVIDNFSQVVKVGILNPYITISSDSKTRVNNELEITTDVNWLTGDIVWQSSNKNIATVENGLIQALSEGTVTISATCSGFTDSLTIAVFPEFDVVAPEFVLDEDYEEVIRLNWNKDFDPLKGVTAVDDYDGDITENIVINNAVDNQTYGLQSFELTITDSSGNKQTLTRTVEVVWDYTVTFIGHAGSYYGLMNSEEAILYAVQVLKYQAVEVDIKKTKDGVFVLSHDDTFNGINIGNTNWADLKNVTYTAPRSQGFPYQNGSVTGSPYTTKLCTLDRYLDICKQYHAKPVIELKSPFSVRDMPTLMNIIEEKGLREDVILLNNLACLKWTRENGYEDIVCQYLVSTIESGSFLQICIDYNFEISTNVTYGGSNDDEWLQMYKDSGVKISTYTFTQYSSYADVQKWIDKGIDYVTVDWHVMSELILPEKE